MGGAKTDVKKGAKETGLRQCPKCAAPRKVEADGQMEQCTKCGDPAIQLRKPK